MDDHFMGLLVRERLAEAEALVERWARLRAACRPRRPLRVRLGTALIRAGQWLLRRAPDGSREPSRSA